MSLVSETETLLAESQEAAALLGIAPRSFTGFPDIAGAVLCAVARVDTDLIRQVYEQNPDIAEQSIYDITETARRNFEPGGAAATFLFSRGVHAIMAHRVAHKLWQNNAGQSHEKNK